MDLSTVFQGVMTALARGVALPWYARKYRQFERRLACASQVQRSWLLTHLGRSRDTRFGRDHRFAEIHTVADFRRRVPVAGYEHFAPYIDAVARGEVDALFPASERLLRFTITTGTTGTPKLNPVTATWLREYLAAWDVWGTKLVLDHPKIIGTRLLQVVGTWEMGHTPSGLPVSMVSALAARQASPIARQFYALPDAVGSIRDPLAKYYTMLRLSMTQNIGLITGISPGTLVRLAELGNTEKHRLIRDIRDGTLSLAFDIPVAIREQLEPFVQKPARDQARRLEKLAENSRELYPRDYWSNPVICCWLGGTAGYQSRYLPEFYGETPRRDLGLVSSEGRHTIPLGDGDPSGVLAMSSNFYEFIPLAESDSSSAVVLEAHELDEGHDYSLVMTTSAGYCRFEIGDIVRCRGYVGEAPVLEFLQKRGRCGDLEGEKLTEHQFIEAAGGAAAELGIKLGYITAVPSRPTRELPCYIILLEHRDVPETRRATQLVDAIDRRLAATNFLYGAERKSQVLGPPKLWRLPDFAWSRHIQSLVLRRGTGESQYKHPALVTDSSLLEQFAPVDVVEIGRGRLPSAA